MDSIDLRNMDSKMLMMIDQIVKQGNGESGPSQLAPEELASLPPGQAAALHRLVEGLIMGSKINEVADGIR